MADRIACPETGTANISGHPEWAGPLRTTIGAASAAPKLLFEMWRSPIGAPNRGVGGDGARRGYYSMPKGFLPAVAAGDGGAMASRHPGRVDGSVRA